MRPIYVLTRWGDRAQWRFDSFAAAEKALPDLLSNGDDVTMTKLVWPSGFGELVGEGRWPTFVRTGVE